MASTDEASKVLPDAAKTPAGSTFDSEPVIAALTDGLKSLVVPDYSGGLTVWGSDARSVFALPKDMTAPLVAIAMAGKGRLAVASTDQWLFAPEIVRHAESTTFVTRLISWLANGGKKLILIDQRTVAPELKGLGYDLTVIKDAASLPADLGGVAAILIGTPKLADRQREQLQAYLEGGGAVFVAMQGQMMSTAAGLPLEETPLFALSKAFGISHTSANWGDDLPHPYDPAFSRSRHLGLTLERLLDVATGKQAGNSATVETDIALLRDLMPDAKPNLGYPSPAIRDSILAYYQRSQAELIPSEKKPIAKDDLRHRAGIALVTFVKMHLEPELVGANASATAFPGAVAADAARISATIDVDGAVPGWHSTGLYAAPGDVITVTIPAAEISRRLNIRIGSHNDKTWSIEGDENWRRWPDITLERRLEKAETKVANPHGGLIYVTVSGTKAGKLAVNIDGAVAAPRYILGSTTAASWRDIELKKPAPWVEIENERMIFTLPKSVAATISDPGPGSDWWRRHVDFQTELSQRPPHAAPERYCQDIQISGGFLHSGYPIMGLYSEPADLFNMSFLNSGREWGVPHELGHNRQRSEWTFEGTGEVTCNLFNVFANASLTGIDAWDLPVVREIQPRAVSFLAAPSFAKWKDDAGVALIMYLQLAREFGWQPYKDVFKEYELLPDAQRPKTDAAKRDQWMVRMSKRLGRNLGPFFDTWKVPVSDAAKAQVKDLPSWNPLPI